MTDPNLTLEPSFCDNVPRPKGVGYTPPPGSKSHLYTLPNGAGAHGIHTMDLSAHGFGEMGNVYSMERQRLRYGPNFHGMDINQPRFLSIDFESLFGLGSIYLSSLACDNKFGTAKTLSCYPTLQELHDYYAVNPEEGFKALGLSGSVSSNPPGIPILISCSSPSPGVIKVVIDAARSKGHTSYQVGLWHSEVLIDSPLDLSLPPIIGQIRVEGTVSPGKERKEITVDGLEPGFYRVKARSLIGASVGRWTPTTGLVEVKQGAVHVPTPTLPPTPPKPPLEPQHPIPATPTIPPTTPNLPGQPTGQPTPDPRDLKIKELENKLFSVIENYDKLSNKIEDAIQEMDLFISKLDKKK